MNSIWKLECNDNDDEPLYFTTKQKAEEYLARRDETVKPRYWLDEINISDDN
jgi:hypothetical protein